MENSVKIHIGQNFCYATGELKSSDPWRDTGMYSRGDDTRRIRIRTGELTD